MDELDNFSEEDYSLLILKNRLAKGEISIKEFNTLKATLLENNPLQKRWNETKNETGINKINQIGNEINPLPQSILGEVRPVLEYDCTYLDGHSKYRDSIKGRLLLERARKESSIIFHSKYCG